MPKEREPGGSRRVACLRIALDRAARSTDAVVVEEPLELRVRGEAVATIMRTPGSDLRLAAGFFLTEGWISGPADIGSIALCPIPGSRPDRGRAGRSGDNVADLIPARGASLPSSWAKPRALTSSSSCGVCGKRTIDEVLGPMTSGGVASGKVTPGRPAGNRAAFPAKTILSMPERLRARQAIFEATGSLHAAALFTASGELLVVEEDVGRHNAVDKAVGWALLEGLLPLTGTGLQVSGRVSFEIVQKAHRAGIPLVAAVSGVSSLAVDFALRAGITLAGFVRGSSLTVYTHPERVIEVKRKAARVRRAAAPRKRP